MVVIRDKKKLSGYSVNLCLSSTVLLLIGLLLGILCLSFTINWFACVLLNP
jgi:hypothetical protein